jgi:hypothetical protein
MKVPLYDCRSKLLRIPTDLYNSNLNMAVTKPMNFPYSKDEILRGLRDPSKVQRELQRKASSTANNIRYKKINAKKEREQQNKSSKYGLVVNWGLHQTDHWTVALYPIFCKSIY